MKLLCVIDTLDSGGAQRQLCTLASMLKKQGWGVSMLAYHPGDFFLPLLRDAGVEYTCLPPSSHLRRAWAIRRLLRHGDQDVVLAFLDGPVLYAELASLPYRRWGLVVSERNAIPWAESSRLNRLRRFHRLADYVTTNSHANRVMIEHAVPALKGRVVTIYNTVDFGRFTLLPPPPSDGNEVRLVVAARYEPQKNPEGLIRAIGIVRRSDPSAMITLDWHGRHRPGRNEVYQRARSLVDQLGLADRVRLHGETRAITAEYARADAVVMPSFFEGLSNTVCEAMACGRPILSSDVCDAGNLVQNGVNGFLFDPASPEDIAAAIMRFVRLSKDERATMGLRSRDRAAEIFDSRTVVDRYDQVLTAAATRKRLAIPHWVPEVPDAVYGFTGRESSP